MTHYLRRKELEEISHWSTCSISNGIELFNIRPRNEGFMLPEIKCIFLELGPMIGYAVTAMISADSPGGHRIEPAEWWEDILKIPEPRIAVIHDLDRPVIGSFWGEVNASIHKALGCVGAVTDGSVRDLDEVRKAGFHFFSSCVSVSHAYVHLVEVGLPVKVGGLTVKPGDLIFGDQHGVLSIPHEIAKDVSRAAKLVEDWERPVIDTCKSTHSTPRSDPSTSLRTGARGMLRVDTERRFSLDSARDGELVEPLPRFKNRGLAPSNVSKPFSIEGLKDRYLSPRPTWPPRNR